MTLHVASTGNPDHEVRVYQVEHPDVWTASDRITAVTYYWCCERDGACSGHVPTIEDAISGAHAHTEEHNG